jgi:hypothetical protein
MDQFFARSGAQLTVTLLVVFLGACAPKANNPSTGRISLAQSGTSESGLQFVLENDTSRSVFFRGWINKDAIPMPSYSGSCYGDTSSGRPTSVFVGTSPTHTTPEKIKVESGARVQLIVARDDLEPFKGERCRIALEIDEGLTVESTPFVP